MLQTIDFRFYIQDHVLECVLNRIRKFKKLSEFSVL